MIWDSRGRRNQILCLQLSWQNSPSFSVSCIGVFSVLCGQTLLPYLVNPAGLRSAILLVILIGWNIVPMLVEGYSTVVLAHIDFELACSPAAFPAVVGIPQVEIALGRAKHQPFPRQEFYVEESEQ